MDQIKNKHLLYVGTTPYPNGMASSNRLSGLLEGLAELGWDVNVVCLASTKYPTCIEQNKKYYERQGTHNGVNFKYFSAQVKASKNKINRICSHLWGMLSFLMHLNSFRKKAGYRIFLTNQTKPIYVIYYHFLNLILKYRFVLLRSEIPSCNQLLSKWCFKNFDGFLLMTYYLKDYFMKYIRDSSKVQILPMTVKNERFSEPLKSPFSFEYIAYAGSLSIKKDGIDMLLKSYCSISEEFPAIHLVIIGDDSDFNLKETLLNIIASMPLATQERIHFTGLLDRKDIPTYLNNAKVLALARPDSLQAQAGFPSKLGEYLSTGKPVVVTETGEIPIYLTDGESAFLCPPGDVAAFSSKLVLVLSNYSNALKVGLRGQNLAKKRFNSKIQAKEMSIFFEKLI